MEPDLQSEAESRKQLVTLLTRHQRQIFSYIYVLVPNRTDAEDLLQETSLVICEKFADFTLGTDYGPELTLSDLRGQIVVLYFYPKDDTPG